MLTESSGPSQAAADGDDTFGAANTFKELYEFARAHFQREEENMQTVRYAGYPQQKAAHENLLGKVRELITSLERGEEVDLLDVMSFLQEWLIKHILVMDRQ